MKFLKRAIVFTLLAICILGCCGCGDKDLRIFKKDITAVVDGEEQPLFYVEKSRKHEPGETDLSVRAGADNIYFRTKDTVKTIPGTTHEVTVTFDDVKPIFRKEDVRFLAIGRDVGSDPDNDLSYGDYALYFPVTDFESKKGKVSFRFEIDKLFANDVLMYCITLWYGYDYENIYISMGIPEEQFSDQPTDWGPINSNPVHRPPVYPD